MTCTLLPLDTFRYELGWNPWHFWQLATESSGPAPLTDHCSTLLRQYSWQNTGAAGRSEILDSIATAELILQQYLKYAPGSHYVTKSIDLPCFVHETGRYPMYVHLGEGRLSRIATETLTLIDSYPVTYSDSEGDGLDDKFSLTVLDSTTTDLSSIEVYFSEDEVFVTKDLCELQIRPVLVRRVAPDTISIIGDAWLCVRPLLYEGARYASGFDQGALNPTDPANFATTLVVYRRETSDTNQATLTYNNGCGTESSHTVCVTIADGKTGQVLVQPGDGCPCTCGASFWPWDWGGWQYQTAQAAKRLDINYRAGADITEWKTTITRLALAELKKKICACDDANAEVLRWQTDAARANGITEEQYRVSNDDLSNPIGTRAGQIWAWNRIKNQRFIRGFNI